MPSHDIWPTLGKIANVIGLVWALVALGVLGYYVTLGVRLVRSGG